ncbi:MAG: TRAFAC clade GTPase domain-containing protein [Candidatus Nanopelagicales bacterium]
MDEVGVFLLLFLAAVVAIGFVLWVVAAALARVFAWVLVFWIAAAAAGLAVGILTGVVLPPRVLRGKAREKPEIATPDAVVAGKVLGEAPKGPAKHFGWDRAWPLYNPHQAKRDANAVLGQTKRIVKDGFGWLFSQRPKAAWIAVLLPPFVGFAIGAWLSTLVWYVVMALLGGAFYLVQQMGVLGYRWYERLIRRRRKATLRCAKCYRVTTAPSYRCSNGSCSTIHYDVRPGPLGIVHRRCGCGTTIPATVGSAAKHLTTVCPFCLQDVPKGSGTRRVLPVPVIGAVGAGKTQFLSSGVVELQGRVKSLSGSLTPISPVAEQFLTAASTAMASGQRVVKTAWEDKPEGVPLVLSYKGKELEVQLMDAAGENFVDWERTQGLGYISTADVLLFILDPLALPKVNEQLRIAKKADVVPIAQGDPEDSYASVVDRLRAEDVQLGSKSLAIVLTKYDVLQTLPGLGRLEPSDSSSIKAWLRNAGAEGFIRRVDQDFKRVEYFAVDSYGTRNGFDAEHPVRVLDWALRTTDPRLRVIPDMAPAPAGEGAA